MKVVLANAPWYRDRSFFVRAGSRWPHFEPPGAAYMPFPFFMGYAAALLEQHAVPVAVVDGCAEFLSRETFLERVLAESPTLVLLETSSQSLPEERSIAAALKRGCPEVLVAMAGPWVDPDGASLLEKAPEADFFLPGEYETTLREVVQTLGAGGSLYGIRGLEFREGAGVVRTSPRELLEDLDALPHPARHLFPMDRYQDLVGSLPQPSLQLWGSRGCPFGCTFCVWPQLVYRSRRYRPRAPEAIVAELDAELARRPYRSFYFDDDTFNLGEDRIQALARLLQERKTHLPWGMMARADTSGRETLELLRESGLTAAKFGLESGCQPLVDAARKDLDLGQAIANIRFARELGIQVHLTFTFGLPGETRATVRRTVDLALDLDPETVQFSILTPFPGSRLFSDLRDQGLLREGAAAGGDGYSRAVLATSGLSAVQLEQACAYADRRWRKHQVRRALRQSPLALLRRMLGKPARVLGIVKRSLGLG